MNTSWLKFQMANSWLKNWKYTVENLADLEFPIPEDTSINRIFCTDVEGLEQI